LKRAIVSPSIVVRVEVMSLMVLSAVPLLRMAVAIGIAVQQGGAAVVAIPFLVAAGVVAALVPLIALVLVLFGYRAAPTVVTIVASWMVVTSALAIDWIAFGAIPVSVLATWTTWLPAARSHRDRERRNRVDAGWPETLERGERQ